MSVSIFLILSHQIRAVSENSCSLKPESDDTGSSKSSKINKSVRLEIVLNVSKDVSENESSFSISIVDFNCDSLLRDQNI